MSADIYGPATQFKRTIAHLFERVPAELPRNRDEYNTIIKGPIRSLSELNVGDEYMVRVRGSYVLQRARLEEIYITATNGVSFSFTRESNLTFLHVSGGSVASRPSRIPESVHQDDVWFYYTPDRIELLMEGFDRSHSGYNTPATGARTPNSMDGTMTPSQRSGVTTPNSKDATMTPSTRSGTATPSTQNQTGTPSTRSGTATPSAGSVRSGPSAASEPLASGTVTPSSIRSSGTSTPKSQLGVPLILEAHAVDIRRF
jgi:hypothetical protein